MKYLKQTCMLILALGLAIIVGAAPVSIISALMFEPAGLRLAGVSIVTGLAFIVVGGIGALALEVNTKT